MHTDLSKLFSQFSTIHLAVIGDAMLDTYWWGHVERISPEAPVPVVTVDKKEHRIGGAANVALNASALGAKVSLITVLGNDEDAHQLTQLLQQKNIGTDYLVKSRERLTTNKIRIISRNQQMLRLDNEKVTDLSKSDEDKLLYAFENYLAAESPHVVVMEDYNKGILTPRVISKIISLCKKHRIITAADPKRKNFFSYAGVDIFKPNLKEVKDGLNLLAEDINLEILKDIHLKLKDQLQHEISFITLSEKGAFYQKGDDARLIASHVRQVADVSGAGDTVMAVASLVYAATKNVQWMADIANIAGGLVCEEVGTVAIDKATLLEACKRILKN